MKKSVSKNKLLLFIFFLGLFFVTALTIITNQTKAACVVDATCDYGAGENMFNCKADCLPPGVPTKSIKFVIEDVTSWVLGFAVSISVAILIWCGISYVTSSGDAQKAETAKKIAKYVLMGLLFAGISYAILVIVSAIFGP